MYKPILACLWIFLFALGLQAQETSQDSEPAVQDATFAQSATVGSMQNARADAVEISSAALLKEEKFSKQPTDVEALSAKTRVQSLRDLAEFRVGVADLTERAQLALQGLKATLEQGRTRVSV